MVTQFCLLSLIDQRVCVPTRDIYIIIYLNEKCYKFYAQVCTFISLGIKGTQKIPSPSNSRMSTVLVLCFKLSLSVFVMDYWNAIISNSPLGDWFLVILIIYVLTYHLLSLCDSKFQHTSENSGPQAILFSKFYLYSTGTFSLKSNYSLFVHISFVAWLSTNSLYTSNLSSSYSWASISQTLKTHLKSSAQITFNLRLNTLLRTLHTSNDLTPSSAMYSPFRRSQ